MTRSRRILYKLARITENVLQTLFASRLSLCVMCTLTATHLTIMYACTRIRESEPLGCFIKQTGINIYEIPNMWGIPEIKPVTTGLASVY